MTFHLENIGRVNKADIDIKPLTLFIGKNDSGKTYAASAIWAIANFISNRFEDSEILALPEVSSYIERTKNLNEDYEILFEFSESTLNEIRNSVQRQLNSSTPALLGDVIGYDGFTKSKLSFTHEDSHSNIQIRILLKKSPEINQIEIDLEGTQNEFDDHASEAPIKPDKYTVEYTVFADGKRLRAFPVNEIDADFVQLIIHREAIRDLMGYAYLGERWRLFRNPIYLPAARTGIMLAIDYFVRGTMHQYALPVKDKIDNIPTLPLPLRDFASRLTDSIYVRRDTTIASNQLKSIIAGSYKATKRRGEYQYQPAGLEKPIPLASTSSLVTELAGFALILGQLSYTTGFIVFEEPEAHLHLDAQREMAKILVGLANQGRHLIITTHSDTFLQQINNLIALNDHPDAIALRSKLNIPEEYTINRENVAAYDFICNDGVTVAKKLECTNTGFIATSLNEILLKIAQETYEINSGWNQN